MPADDKMDRPSYESKYLQAEDFRRLGVRLQEWRPAVIRQAAARIARGLAQKQLQSPTERTARELTSVTVSTYRVLDPRRRNESSERVSVGRILPLALNAASHTRFCNGLPEQEISQQLASTLSENARQLISDESPVELFGEIAAETTAFGIAASESHQSLTRASTPIVVQQPVSGTLPLETAFDPGNHVATRLESDSLLKYYSLKRFFVWLRRAIQRPAFITGLVVLTVIATFWVGRFGRTETKVAASVDIPPVVLSTPDPEDTRVVTSAVLPADDRGNLDLNSDVRTDINEGPTPDEAQNDHDIVDAHDSQAADAERVDEETAEQTRQWFEAAVIRAKQLANRIENAFASSKAAPNRPFSGDPFKPAQGSPLSESETSVDDRPLPVPNEEALAKATQQLRQSLPQTFDIVSLATATERISRLEEIRSAAEPGSAEFWVTTMVAAKIGWSTRESQQVRTGLQALADSHHVSIESLMADSFLQRQAFVETSDTHRSVMRGGFSVAESLLRDQSLEQCKQVVELTNRSAEFLADKDALAQLKDYEDALEQMVRLRLKANEIVRWADAANVAASDAAIAGRYQCLYLRDWASGLQWLANSKDPRLAVLAKSEIELMDGTADANRESGADSISSIEEEWSQLAGRWLAVASRRTGRVAESMRLHALALNEKALRTARGTTKLLIQREIDEIRQSMSRFALDSEQNLASASWTL